MIFSGVKTITIHEGNVTQITAGSTVLWEKPASYTNLADPTSPDWVVGYRINSSGGISAESSYTVTNYIPCKQGDVLRVKGLDLRVNGQRIASYEEDGTLNRVYYCTNAYSSVVTSSSIKEKITYENGVSTYTLFIVGEGGQSTLDADTVKIRFAFKTAAVAAEDLIVTINEEIPG